MRAFTSYLLTVALLSNMALCLSAVSGRSASQAEVGCKDEKAEPATQIAACTVALQERRGKRGSLNYFYLLRSQAYERNGDIKNAVSDLTELLKGDQTNAWVTYGYRSRLWLKLGNFEQAIADATRSINSYPSKDKSSPLADRAAIYEKAGNLDAAIADYRAAKNMDRDYPYYGHKVEDLETKKRQAASTPPRPSFVSPQATAAPPLGSPIETKPRPVMSEIRPVTTEGVVPAKLPPPSSTIASQPSVAALPQSNQTGPAAAKTIIRRVALVIGNSAYSSVPSLTNPERDADLVAGSLRKIGVEVTVANNLTRNGLSDALRGFVSKADNSDWAAVYYAGHGIEMNGENWLIPIDAKLASDRDVSFEAVPVTQVLSSVEGAKKLRLVVLDACRDNPFLSQMKRSSATRSIGRGLGRMEPDVGTLVVYAAKHGETATDGVGNNSPFATAFVNRLTIPGLEIRRLFDLVRDDVMAATRRRQQPFSYGSISGAEDFYFVAK